jgi:hypothetical protein
MLASALNPLRELVLGAHRELEVVEPPLGDQHRVREVEERRHPGPQQLVGGVLRAERPQENVDGLRILGRQVRGEGACDVTAAVEKLQRLEPGAGLLFEGSCLERGMDSDNVPGEPLHERGIEELLERPSHHEILPSMPRCRGLHPTRADLSRRGRVLS